MDQPAFTKARFTRFENIPSESFPNHYNFVSYNQLESKVYRKGSSRKQKQPTLTDYIGCLIRVGDIQDVGNPNKNQSKIRRLDVENLNGDVLEITLWDEMAINFSMGRLRQNGTTSYLCIGEGIRTVFWLKKDVRGLRLCGNRFENKTQSKRNVVVVRIIDVYAEQGYKGILEDKIWCGRRVSGRHKANNNNESRNKGLLVSV
ncbi:nucleic acid-binding, OB-fold protein [Tanacetum coccineum]